MDKQEQAANEFLSIPAYKEYLENEYKKRGSDPRYADYYREHRIVTGKQIGRASCRERV